MKTTLIEIENYRGTGSHFIGLGFGLELDGKEFFIGFVIEFLIWSIHVGINRRLSQ